MDGFVVYIVFLAILVAFSAFFSSAEAALFSLTRVQVNELRRHSASGREVARMLSTPRKVLVTILIGNLVVNVLSTSAATSVCIRLFGDKGVGIAFAAMSILILVVGEIVPKVVAVNAPRRVSILNIYILKVFHAAFIPVRLPVAWLADAAVEFVKKHAGVVHRSLSRDELLTAFDFGRDEGHIGEFEHGLLSNIIEFRDTVVREIMTPSINVFSLPLAMDRDELESRILQTDYSRISMYGDTADDIRGILHIKDLAALPPNQDVASILRAPYYVPESTRISDLFKEMARRRSQFALVIDEFGSYVGIVTMEDILEELVGEIRDAKEPRKQDYTLIDERRIVVAGTMEIDAFNEIFGTNIEDDEHETIAGHVIGATGNIPQEGETIDVGDLSFHIISAQPNRIRKLRVEKR